MDSKDIKNFLVTIAESSSLVTDVIAQFMDSLNAMELAGRMVSTGKINVIIIYFKFKG